MMTLNSKNADQRVCVCSKIVHFMLAEQQKIREFHMTQNIFSLTHKIEH